MDNRELSILYFNSSLPGWSELTEKVDQEEELRIAMKIKCLFSQLMSSNMQKTLSFFF